MIKLSEDDKTKQEKRYKMKGTVSDFSLTGNGEFQWTPAPEACSSKEKTQELVDVLKEMPTDKATVWIDRLDLPETIKRCPLLQQDNDIKKEFDDFTAKNIRSKKPKNVIQEQGGEKANGQE